MEIHNKTILHAEPRAPWSNTGQRTQLLRPDCYQQQGYQQNDKGADETTEINTNQGKTSGLQDSSSSLTVQ